MQRRVLFVAALGSFLSSLSSSIVGVVLPRIADWAAVGVADVAWVTLVPLLVIAAMLLPAGWVGDTYGHRETYLAGSVFAVIGSLGCALAWDFQSLLLLRGVQGVGAALAMASAPALVTLTAPRERRGGSLGVTSTALYLGLTLGPPLGGWLESLAGFRAVFFAQVPLSLLLLGVCAVGLPRLGARREVAVRADWPGAVWMGVGVVALLLALARGRDWPAPAMIAALGIGAAAVGGFVRRERSVRDPILDLRLFADRTFLSAGIGAFLNYLALFQASFLLPFYLVEARGMDTGHAGTLLMLMPLVMSVVTGPSGALSDRVGSRSLSCAGMVILGSGLATLTAAGLDTPLGWVVPALILLGLGSGLFVTPNTNTLLSAAPVHAQGGASAVMALARILGMLAGTALAAVVSETARSFASAAGSDPATAMISGFHTAWGVGVLVSIAGAGVVLIRAPRHGSRSLDPPL